MFFLNKKCLHANKKKVKSIKCLQCLFYSLVSKTVWILSTKPEIHSYQFLETQPFRSGTGWHKHCHISGQRHIDSISHVWAHSCVDLANATVWHKQHGGNLYALQPKTKKSNEMQNSSHNYFSPLLRSETNLVPADVHPKFVEWLHTC